MMNLAYSEVLSTTSENRILSFPVKANYFATNSLLSDTFGIENKSFEVKELKELIEGIVFSAMIRETQISQSKLSDPFAALYICDLQPDRINQSDLTLLTKISTKIRDLSDELTFNDGMDD